MGPTTDYRAGTVVNLLGWSLMVGLLLLINTGCSVYMATHQPKAKDISVLRPGTHRGLVIAELGAPVWSGPKDGDKVDIFSFKRGYSTEAKTARALFHGVADVFTLGLWEVLSTPAEGIFSGTDYKSEVTYDNNDQVKSVKNLVGSPLPVEPNQGHEESPARKADSG